MLPCSKAQAQFAAHGDGALALAYGAVRSGKTFAGCFGFFVHTQRKQPHALHLITGRSKAVLQREIVRSLTDFAECFDLRVDYKAQTGDLRIGAVDYYVSAGYDQKSEGRIRGLSVGSVLFDEATLPPQEYFEQTVARMTFDDSKMWAMCNPDSTTHWLKRNWIDEGKFGGGVYHLAFDDNPSLSDTVKARNEGLFAGVFHSRMVCGEWTDATGLIYPRWTFSNDYDRADIAHSDVGIDYGTAGVTAFVLVDYLRDKRAVVGDVWYWDCEKEGRQLTDDEVVREFKKFCARNELSRGVAFVDPSAASLILSLRRDVGVTLLVRPADNDVLNGLRVCGAALANERLLIGAHGTAALCEELYSYRWQEGGEDAPVKQDDHAVDALRYAYYTRNKWGYETHQHIPIPDGL